MPCFKRHHRHSMAFKDSVCSCASMAPFVTTSGNWGGGVERSNESPYRHPPCSSCLTCACMIANACKFLGIVCKYCTFILKEVLMCHTVCSIRQTCELSMRVCTCCMQAEIGNFACGFTFDFGQGLGSKKS